MASSSSSLLVGLLLLGLHITTTTEAQSVGVCYGRNGNNLPSDQDVVALYKSNGIGRMRIYDPNPSTLQALRGSGIELILDVPRDKVQSLTDAGAAASWVQTNVVAYPDVNFKYIAVGNEIHPGDSEASSVLPAMQRVRDAIVAANLQDKIKVSTAIDTTLVAAPAFPPSSCAYADTGYISPIVNFLATTGAPILINVYTYFSHRDNQQDVPLSYALFTDTGVRVTDGQYQYQNIFDAMVDSQYAALEKVGGSNVRIVVSESGWPSEGGFAASPENAGTYYKNLGAHVKQGTPRRAGQALETYLFALFDENLKEAGIEQHFGVFSPNKSPKYQLSFN